MYVSSKEREESRQGGTARRRHPGYQARQGAGELSRHYGKEVDEGRTISVWDALVGINQLIDEDADKGKEPPPVNAEPMTRQFLRTFDSMVRGHAACRSALEKAVQV